MGTGSKSIDAILSEAVEIESATERSAFLNESCGEDSYLRQRLDKLVRDHFKAGSVFLEEPPAPFCDTLDQPLTEKPGAQIGPYKLREKLGEGGFGVVYVAEQTERVRRKVALKVIKPGMDTKEIIARFEAERQALALMDHPNIARVLDAGATKRGRPYFVMELIRGIPITRYCDENRLGARERLTLLVQAAQAIQHAHQKGIIHRDVKPSNVLVTERDGTPTTKVIDFGVAKAINQRLTEQSIYTHFGQMVGTPAYMSPEQAVLSEFDVDTRTDVYSLGVLLYELLTGTTPFDRETLRQAGYDEMRRIIQEDEPPRPSTRVSTLGPGLATISAARGCQPQQLSRILRGELDWIIMRSLEKDRNRRYESPSALAQDLRRYLDDEPVHACPPNLFYQLRKLGRRHKPLLTTAALVCIALLVGTAVASWQAVRATREAKRAALAEGLAERRLDQVDAQRLRAESNVQLALDALEQVYLPLAEAELSGRVELDDQDRHFLEQTLPFYETLAAQTADNTQAQYARARAYLRVANIYTALRTHPNEKNAPAEHALRRAISLFEELVEQDPKTPEYRRELAISFRDLGDLLYSREPNEAERAYRTSIAIYEGAFDNLSGAELYGLHLAHYRLAVRLWTEWGRIDEAIDESQIALELSERLLADNPDSHDYRGSLLNSLKALATTCYQDGRLEAAEQHARSLIKQCERWSNESPDRPGYQFLLGGGLRILGTLQMRRNQPQKSEQSHLRGWDVLEGVVQRHPQVSWYRHNLAHGNLKTYARFLESRQRFEEAERVWSRAIELHDQLAIELPHGPYRSRANANRCSLAGVLRKLGRTEDAEKIIQAIDVKTTKDYTARAEFYLDIGDTSRAAADFRKAVELNPDNFAAHRRFAEALRGMEDKQEAVARLTEAIAEYPDVSAYYRYRGVVRRDNGEYDAALADLNRAVELLPDNVDGQTYNSRAILLTLMQRYEDAAADYDRHVERDANSAAALKNRADFYIHHRNDYRLALADLDVAIEKTPNAGHLYKRRGLAYFRLGHYDDALADIAHAVDLNRNGGSILWWIPPADVAVCPDDDFRSGMLEIADRAVGLAPDSASTRLGRASLLIELGQHERAEADYKKILELAPSAFVCNNAAWSIAQAADSSPGLVACAVELAEKAVAVESQAAYWNTLGVARYRAGSWQEATEALKMSIELNDSPHAFDSFFLAMAHWQMGHKDEAFDWYHRAVEWTQKNQPDNEELRQFQAEAKQLLQIASDNPTEQPDQATEQPQTAKG